MSVYVLKQDRFFYPLIFAAWVGVLLLRHAGHEYYSAPLQSAPLPGAGSGVIARKELATRSIEELTASLHSEKDLTERGHIQHNIGAAYYDLYKASNPAARAALLDSARLYFSNSLRYVSDVARFYYNLGRVYTEMRDHANARLAYERTLARDPKHVLALHNLGLLNHFELGDEEEAERLLKRALQIHPLMPIANFVLGDIAVTTGDYSEAIGYFNQEIESFLHYDSADRSLPIADAIRRFALQKSHYRLAILYSTRHPDRKLAQLNLNHYLRLEPDKTMRRKAIGEMKRYWVTR